jgi:hypothetical protein
LDLLGFAVSPDLPFDSDFESDVFFSELLLEEDSELSDPPPLPDFARRLLP